MTRERLRLDFTDHPTGSGWAVILNGCPLADQFRDVGEVLELAEGLGVPARYAGLNPAQIEAEGGGRSRPFGVSRRETEGHALSGSFLRHCPSRPSAKGSFKNPVLFRCGIWFQRVRG